MPEGGNLFLCVVLSAIGSASYIFGIMALAYPAFLVTHRRNGQPYPTLFEYGFFGLYALGQSGALFLPLVATWYGPVAIALPVYQATMLMWNMIVMSVLGMQSFTKSEMIGTLVLMVSSFMLLEAGPRASAARDAESYDQIGTLGPLLWILFLAFLWGVSAWGMVVDFMEKRPLPPGGVMATYVVAQGIGTSGTTSLGKILPLTKSGSGLFVTLILYALCGSTNTYSSIAAAKKINQGEFIPFASCCSLLLNAATGLVLWEDGKSITMWVTYAGIYVLVILGVYLLSSADVVQLVRAERQRKLTVLAETTGLVSRARWQRLQDEVEERLGSERNAIGWSKVLPPMQAQAHQSMKNLKIRLSGGENEVGPSPLGSGAPTMSRAATTPAATTPREGVDAEAPRLAAQLAAPPAGDPPTGKQPAVTPQHRPSRLPPGNPPAAQPPATPQPSAPAPAPALAPTPAPASTTSHAESIGETNSAGQPSKAKAATKSFERRRASKSPRGSLAQHQLQQQMAQMQEEDYVKDSTGKWVPKSSLS